MESRHAYHHGDLRLALVEAAEQLVRDAGAEVFSLREAARSVGVTPNASYRHFEDKGALLTEVARRGFLAMAKRMTHALESLKTSTLKSKQRASDSFIRIGEAYVEFALAEPELFRVMFGRYGVRCMAPHEQLERSPYQMLAQALDEMLHVGACSKESRVGAELRAWTVVHGFACLAIDGATLYPSNTARATALRSVLEFAVRGLARAQPQVSVRAVTRGQ
jgi:AcrR family transcriptional regulator